jgi:ABC-type enterobactin transport system permease subunit
VSTGQRMIGVFVVLFAVVCYIDHWLLGISWLSLAWGTVLSAGIGTAIAATGRAVTSPGRRRRR